jgi:hypothetical protein
VLIFRAIKIVFKLASFSRSLIGGPSPVPVTQKRLLICSVGAAPWYFPDPRRVASFYLEQGQRVRLGTEDSERLELDWLLKCDLEELIASVRPMSAKNCEQIVRAILDRIGGPTFEQLLTRIVATMVPMDGRAPPRNSDEYYFAVRDLFPQVPPENDILGRLLCFALRMCQLRIEKSLNLTAH